MNFVYLLFLVIAFATAQILIGGTRLLFSLPSYGLIAATAVLSVVSIRRRTHSPSLLCLLTATALAAYVLVRASFSPVDYLANHDFYMVFAAFIVYLFTALYITDPRHRLLFGAALLVFAMVHIYPSMIQFREGDSYMPISWLQRTTLYGERASGFYICPNHFAGLLEILAMVGVGLIAWARWKVTGKVLVAYAVLMAFLGIGLSGSRGGYISTIVGLAVIAALSLVIVQRIDLDLFFRLLTVVVVTGVLLLGAAVFLIQRSDLLSDRVNNFYDTRGVRYMMWGAAMKQFSLSPIVGTGSGTYFYYGREFRDPNLQRDPQHVHNDYLELLAEYGIIGAALFLAFLVTHLVFGLRAQWRSMERMFDREETRSNVMAVNIGVLGALAALSAHSMVDFNVHIPANALIVAYLFGILANADVTRPREPSDPRLLVPRIVLPLLGIAFLILGMPKIRGEYFAERARMALRDDKPRQARSYAERGLAEESANPNLHYYLGEALRQMAPEARKADPSKWHELHGKAIDAFNMSLELFPRDTNALLKLSQAHMGVWQYTEAEQALDRAREGDPNLGNLYAYYGLLYRLQEEFSDAAEYYMEALELDPDSELAKLGMEELRKEVKRRREEEE